LLNYLLFNEEENIFIDELSNKTELEFDSNIGEKTINIIATKDYAWNTSIEDIISNNSGNWVKIEPSTGVGGGKETPTKVYIRVNPNDNEKERQVKITFSIDEEELDDTLNTSYSKYSIIVKQKNKNNDENLDSDVTPGL
jgi:hypothetical protein